MKVEASAGAFSFVTYTDGIPHWTEISVNGNMVARIDAQDIPDLAYAAQRFAMKLADALQKGR